MSPADIYPGSIVRLPSGAVVEVLPSYANKAEAVCSYKRSSSRIPQKDASVGVSLSVEFLLKYGVAL